MGQGRSDVPELVQGEEPVSGERDVGPSLHEGNHVCLWATPPSLLGQDRDRQGSQSWSPPRHAQSEPCVWSQRDKHVFWVHSILKGEPSIFILKFLS